MSKRFKRLRLGIAVLPVLLGACQSASVAPECPQATPVPAALAQSDSPDAGDYSERVGNYLQRVRDWLNASPPEKTP